MEKMIAIIISIVIICLNIFELIHAGFFRDVHPNININEVELYFFWGSLFLSIAFLVTILYFITKQNMKKNRQIADKCIMLLIAVLVCLNIFVGVKYYSIVKDYSLNTIKDRDGARSKEMYDLLDKYGIESVPCIIMVKDSIILKMWTNPIEQLDDIENFL